VLLVAIVAALSLAVRTDGEAASAPYWLVATARTVYVSPSGSDSGPGTRDRPWRTVARVNRASLAPGDRVLFEGGRRFAGALEPTRSGTAGRPITFGSYGRGMALLEGGVFLQDVAYLTFSDLEISGARQGVLAGPSGSGVSGLTLRGLVIRDVGIGINSANPADRGWSILDSTVARTQDSGLIILGARILIEHNKIADTGLSKTIPYGRHGIYAKGPDLHIRSNTISGFATEGVSIRFRNALVEDNEISGGPTGIGYYQDSDDGGRSVIRRNTIRVGNTGIYLDPSTVERFIIHDNVIVSPDSGVYISRVPALWLYANSITAARPIVTDTPYESSPPSDYVDSAGPS
jgi:hypothetical protein